MKHELDENIILLLFNNIIIIILFIIVESKIFLELNWNKTIYCQNFRG